MNLELNLYDVKEVGKDFIVLVDHTTNVKITFADQEPTEGERPPTKEEQAWLFKDILCQVGLEAPVDAVKGPKTINIFLDHRYDFGVLRSRRFPYWIASIEVKSNE